MLMSIELSYNQDYVTPMFNYISFSLSELCRWWNK